MPVLSTLGAMSSRGFGNFNSQKSVKYVEDYFSTTLYTGTGAAQTISPGVDLQTTASWSSFLFNQAANYIYGVTTDSAGNIYLATGVDNVCAVLKISSSGTKLWQSRLATGLSSARKVAVDSSGNVYAVGTLNSTPDSFFVVKYNSSGVVQWKKDLQQGDSIGKDIALDSSGNIYVVGDVTSGSYTAACFAKYDTSGTLLWQRTYKYAGAVNATGWGVAVDSSDNIYFSGSAGDGTVSAAFLAKYNSSGTIQWQRQIYQGSGTAFGVAVDSSNNIYVAAGGVDTDQYIGLLKYNSSGTIQWRRRLYNGDNLSADAVTVDSSGFIYIAGSAAGYGIIAKYDSSGGIQWQRKLNAGTITPQDLHADSIGNLYYAGWAPNNGFVIKLKADGSTAYGTVSDLDLSPSTLTEAASTMTSATGTATDSAGSATSVDSAATATTTAINFSTSTQSATDGSGALVWIKGRSTVTDHALYDTVRGATFDLASNSASGQTTQTTGLNYFGANSFDIGALAKLNTTSALYTAWTFSEAPKFFDVVQYTGTGVARTVSHNLGSVPGMIIVKQTSAGNNNWPVYHRSSGAGSYINLNTTDASISDSFVWNNTLPTSTVFSVGANSLTNTNGATYIAYLFAHDAGGFGEDEAQSVSACGSFTASGTGAATVSLGWEPQFLLIKASSFAEGWYIYDNVRGVYVGSSGAYLFANSTAAENVSASFVSATSTGFTVQSLGPSSTYVYYAIRRGPMAVPTDATKVFMPTVYTGTNVDNRLVNTTIAPDMVWCRQRNDTVLAGMIVGDRMRGAPYLRTGGTNAEVSDADSFMTPTATFGTTFSAMNGFGVGNDVTSKLNVSTVSNNQIAEAFKRAPGFFDVVAYTGTGSNTTVSHNLGVIPELMLIKQRASTTAWGVYAAPIGNTNYLVLNTTAASAAGTTYWNSTTPTSSVFSLGTSTSVNASGGTYVSYLYASCPGVSKVGSYIGTGTTNQIDCGFTSGARFVLIKRTDSTGDWYIWDSARGIVAGNDPYLLLNSTAAEVTNTDYVDTYSAGFELSSTAPAGLNEAPVITWVSRTSGFTATIASVSYGNGLYIAGGDTVPLTTSTDGITWTSRTVGFAGNSVYATEYGNGLYVIGGGTGKLSTSTDGINWTPQTSQFGTDNIFSIAYGNGLYIAVGQNGKLSTSPDGVTWTSRTSGFGTTFIYSAIYANGLYIIGGDTGKLSTSTDGITWTSRTSGFSSADAILGLAYGNGVYVAVGANGVLTTSTDGITWTSRTSGFGTSDINGVTFGGGRFIIVGTGGKLSSSTDGITWTSRTTGTSTSISRVTYGSSGGYVAVGSLGLLLTNNPSYLYLAIA